MIKAYNDLNKGHLLLKENKFEECLNLYGQSLEYMTKTFGEVENNIVDRHGVAYGELSLESTFG